MVRHVRAILDAIRRPDVREEDPAPDASASTAAILTHGDG
jgi:hypothetical protein